jgi:phasin family protein
MARKPEAESILDMFARLGSEMKLPKVDVEAVLDHHRKNLEALEKSVKAGTAGASSLLSRQREMLRDTLNEIVDMTESYRATGNPQELMSRQADFTRKSFEAAVKNAGEVAEIVRKSGTESIDILRERMREGMEEIRAALENRK